MIEIIVYLLSLFTQIVLIKIHGANPQIYIYIHIYVFPSTDTEILFKLYCVFVAHCMFVTRAKGNCTFWILGRIMPLTPLSTLKSTWWIHPSSEPRASLQIHVVCTLMGQSLTTDTVSQMFPTLLYLKRASSVQLLSCIWLFVTPWIAAQEKS